jgi:hypothetical protein
VEAWSRWRGGADNDRRWLVWALVSAILHLPFTPLVGLLGLMGWFLTQDPDIPEGPPITTIPIDLLDEETAPAAAPEPPPAPAEPAASPAPAPDATKPPPREAPDAPPSAAPSAAPAPKPSAEPPGAGAPIADPVSMSGGARKVVDPNANVRLIVDTEKLRSHPLGPRVGSLLSRVHQWRDFMGPTGVDPVRDIDRILIVGPQLRRTGDVVAVIQHSLGRARMRAAIDGLVTRDASGGAWLEADVPVARASADRAERYFVLPSERIVVVTPKSALEAAKAMTTALKIPSLPGNQVATAYIATPHRAFIGMPLRVPESIRWARARVTPVEGGGVRVDIEAEDESAERAGVSAAALERDILQATQLDLGVLGMILGTRPQRFLEKIAFRSEGKRILGELLLTQKQLSSIFELAEMLFVPARPRQEPTSRPARPSEVDSRAPSAIPPVPGPTAIPSSNPNLR